MEAPGCFGFLWENLLLKRRVASQKAIQGKQYLVAITSVIPDLGKTYFKQQRDASHISALFLWTAGEQHPVQARFLSLLSMMSFWASPLAICRREFWKGARAPKGLYHYRGLQWLCDPRAQFCSQQSCWWSSCLCFLPWQTRTEMTGDDLQSGALVPWIFRWRHS